MTEHMTFTAHHKRTVTVNFFERETRVSAEFLKWADPEMVKLLSGNVMEIICENGRALYQLGEEDPENQTTTATLIECWPPQLVQSIATANAAVLTLGGGVNGHL